MAEQIELEEVASTSATNQGQEIEENGFPAPTPVGPSQVAPEDTWLYRVIMVGNMGLLLGYFFMQYAFLGVELFGKLECSVDNPCVGINSYSNFQNDFMALLTLYKIATGDDWIGILEDAMRPCRPGDSTCWSGTAWVAPIYFISFVLLVRVLQLCLIQVSITQAVKYAGGINSAATRDPQN